jgi:hypothetical protein
VVSPAQRWPPARRSDYRAGEHTPRSVRALHLSLWHDLQQRLKPTNICPNAGGRTKEETMTLVRPKYFGWGREGEGITPDEEAFVWARITERFRIDEFDEIKPPRLEEYIAAKDAAK